MMRDRRSARWDTYRQTRRSDLTEAAIAAIRRHGAAVGMDEVAAEAGTSKTVVYRHFADRADLYMAVCERVAATLVEQIRSAMAAVAGPHATTAAGIGAYLRVIESDPEVYRFVVHRPLLDRDVGADAVVDLVKRVGDAAAGVIFEHLTRTGRDTRAAVAWGHGVVGLVQTAADNWLTRPNGTTRDELTAFLTDLAWGGLSGVVTTAVPPSPQEEDS